MDNTRTRCGRNSNRHEQTLALALEVGEPTPLPNPAVFQDQTEAARSQTLCIVIPPDGETEVKLVLQEGKVAQLSWALDRNTVYSQL